MRDSTDPSMNLMGKVSDDRVRSASAKGELPHRVPRIDLTAGFQTDTAISAQSAQSQRELQPWSPDGGANGAAAGSNGRNGHSKDAETFGFDGPPSDTPWDQFETNAKLFGVTTDYKEELYTTKLDRSGTNYRQREKDATRLANEIMGVSLSTRALCRSRPANVDQLSHRRGAWVRRGKCKGRGGEVLWRSASPERIRSSRCKADNWAELKHSGQTPHGTCCKQSERNSAQACRKYCYYYHRTAAGRCPRCSDGQSKHQRSGCSCGQGCGDGKD